MTDAPALDSRTAAEIRTAAANTVRKAAPGWRGGPADPGAAVLASAADMAIALAEQVNQVPERMRRQVLRDLQVRPTRPSAATTRVTFTAAALPQQSLRVPAGTEVATDAASAWGTVVFTTTRDVTLHPTALVQAGTARSWRWAPPRLVCDFTPFDSEEQSPTGPSQDGFWLFVLSTPAPSAPLTFDFTARREPASLDRQGAGPVTAGEPRADSWVWEAWEGRRWVTCPIRDDTTKGLSHDGQLTVEVDPRHTPATVQLDHRGQSPETVTAAGLLRCRPVSATGHPAPTPVVTGGFTLQPVLSITAPAIQAEVVGEEVLGISNGLPGQSFTLARTPLISTEGLRVVSSEDSGQATTWTVVDSFTDRAPTDRGVMVDPVTGTITFPPPDRADPGAFPPAGATVSVPAYLTGGGARGNVDTGAITLVRTPLPQIATVRNHTTASGGADAQPVADALLATPPELPGRMRALTCQEVAVRAVRCGAGAARAVCLPASYAASMRALKPLLTSQPPTPAETVLTFTKTGAQQPPTVPRGTKFRTTGAELEFITTQDSAPQGNKSRAHARQVIRLTKSVTAKPSPDGKPGFHTEFSYSGFTGTLPALKLTYKGEEVRWQLVDDFTRSTPTDCHAVLDPVTGRLFFGPLISYGPGTTRQYGAIPPQGAVIELDASPQQPLTLTKGSAGNVPARTITITDIAPPGIKVTNEQAATAGTDGTSETPDLDPGARHQITLLALPAPPPHPTDRPTLPSTEQLTTALRPALPPNTAVKIESFDFTTLGIRAAVHTDTPLTDNQREHLAHTAEQALSAWFNPLTGGRDGTGWPLGRTVTTGETRTVLNRVPGITHTLGLELCEVNDDGTWSPPTEPVRLSPLGLIHSAQHHVVVLPGTPGTHPAPLDTIVRGTRADQWVGIRANAATVYSITSRQALPPNEHPRALTQKVTTPPAEFRGFDALITLPGNRLLAFQGDKTTCANLDEPDKPWAQPELISKRYPKLLAKFHKDINTGFAEGNTVYLFQGDSYTQFTLTTPPTNSATPDSAPPHNEKITKLYRGLPTYFTRQLDAIIDGQLTGEQYLISGIRYALIRNREFITQGLLAETFPGL
ncbi:putative baseplate assembly protein [Streptomyces sp. NPDC057743]|uniref:putative baseplate assembly protein n=1 Tax=Streptomyces sp. NPDC057743 TaxID=3346236 RepID=UPI0036BFB007